MDDDGLIGSPSTWHKSYLKGGDNLILQRSHSINNYLGDNLVDSIAKANWAVILESFRTLDFGDEGYECFIKVQRDSSLCTNLFNFLHHRGTHCRP